MRLPDLWRVLLATSSTGLSIHAATAGPLAVPTISGVEAHLFENKTAAWSGNLFDPKAGELWNTVAGPKASNAVLIVVQVTGAPDGAYTGVLGAGTKYAVRLSAREAGRHAFDQSQTIPVLDDKGKAYLVFLIYQNGCQPLQLTTKVVGRGAGKPLKKSLDFACGE